MPSTLTICRHPVEVSKSTAFEEMTATLPPGGPLGSEYFQAYPSVDRDLGSIAMDHRALRHHSFTSSSGKEQSALQQ
jgi:hypothetical protein